LLSANAWINRPMFPPQEN